jgi:hypothetical protein
MVTIFPVMFDIPVFLGSGIELASSHVHCETIVSPPIKKPASRGGPKAGMEPFLRALVPLPVFPGSV